MSSTGAMAIHGVAEGNLWENIGKPMKIGRIWTFFERPYDRTQGNTVSDGWQKR